ncbi:hypothetical protein [Geothrix terrae]|uniref:hypothetical protein n=1 Tax=Geothrix terrae TaxID=2922720 RepID=UPI001FAB41AC|nr:hypothetical protein [Geothrix terrae]
MVRPSAAFTEPPPTLGRALARMLAVWVPLSLANTGLTVWRALESYGQLRHSAPPAWLEQALGADPDVLRELLRSLPPPPAFGAIWPWLLLVVPLGVLGTWIHDAVWDHAGLWLVGGLKAKRGFRVTLVAEAEALRITALGTLIDLLGFVPVLGMLLALPLLLLDGYLWLFRGFALGARHGCGVWRGVAATVVHAILLGTCALGLAVVLLAMLRVAA